jgi:ribosomal protein S18 acetylase RimI-like enzyme
VYRLTIVVHPASTGRGAGTALMRELMGWASCQPELEKIELLVRATNTRAIALYRRFGFVDEGRFRRRVRTTDGALVDDIAMAWLKERRTPEPIFAAGRQGSGEG